MAIAVPGPFSLLPATAGVVLLLMAFAARLVATRIAITPEALVTDFVAKRRRSTDRHGWKDVGMVAAHQFFASRWDVVIAIEGDGSTVLGLYLSDRVIAKSFAAAVEVGREAARQNRPADSATILQ